jgi:hypothetical protein
VSDTPVSPKLLDKAEEVLNFVRRDVMNFEGDPDCEKACAKTITMLSSREDIDAVCMHEAGHFIESVRLGVMAGFREEHITYNAARVIYRPANLGSKFEGNPGSIQTTFDANKVTFTVPLFEQIARVAVAGGVFANRLAGRPLFEGTDGDREMYETYYRMALKSLHAQKDFKEASGFCRWAKDAVVADLDEHPTLALQARIKAAGFRDKYYLPFLELADLIH